MTVKKSLQKEQQQLMTTEKATRLTHKQKMHIAERLHSIIETLLSCVLSIRYINIMVIVISHNP